MKSLFAFAAVAAALAIAPIQSAHAAASPGAELQPLESTSVSAMRALITRCLPSVVSGQSAPASGMSALSPQAHRTMLGDRDGSVWMDQAERVVMIDFHDAPVCRVIALSVDPAVLADLVMRVFSEAETPFYRERFRMDEGGGFAATYSSGGDTAGIVIRIETTDDTKGGTFATLSVEEDRRETAQAAE